jgi:hypothetical protein
MLWPKIRSFAAAGKNRARSHPSASPPRYPILVGISGKRLFDEKDPNADARIAQAFAERLRSVFVALDEDFPQTPKVLLTGAALGADLIAAEAALEMGAHWAVAAILPFDRALFDEDFRSSPDEPLWEKRFAAYARMLERVLGSPDQPNPKVLVRELPKLLREHGARATTEELSRQSVQPDITLRRNHYEQVGQFIAEISTIMIAVMTADEQPETSEANGGTARIVAYRRAGCPDLLGAAVTRRSKVLRHEWSEVMQPPGGYIWLMDPRKPDRAGRYPVKVLPPLVDRSGVPVRRIRRPRRPPLDLVCLPAVDVDVRANGVHPPAVVGGIYRLRCSSPAVASVGADIHRISCLEPRYPPGVLSQMLNRRSRRVCGRQYCACAHKRCTVDRGSDRDA